MTNWKTFDNYMIQVVSFAENSYHKAISTLFPLTAILDTGIMNHALSLATKRKYKA